MAEREDFALRAVHDWSATLPDLAATPDELSCYIRLSRVAALQDRLDDQTLRQFEPQGVRGTDDFRALALLRRSDAGLTNSELIDQLGGSKAGMSARLERLTSQGITERIPSEVDRRSHTNSLTTEGEHLADAVVTAVVGTRKILTESLTEGQVAELASTLGQIIEGMNPGG